MLASARLDLGCYSFWCPLAAQVFACWPAPVWTHYPFFGLAAQDSPGASARLRPYTRNPMKPLVLLHKSLLVASARSDLLPIVGLATQEVLVASARLDLYRKPD